MNDLALRFRRLYGSEPQLYRAPGRVNLIGEHTDYTGGLVMPVALQFATQVAIAPRADRRLCVRSANLDASFECELPDDFATAPPARAGAWYDYVVGVVWALGRAGLPVPAANLLVEGNVPLGAGLSSSAALEVATAWALLGLAGIATPDPMQVAKLCQQAENEHVGTRCGLMDQFASAHGQQGHALLFDCRSLAFEALQVGDAAIVICNSLVRHSLASGEYNHRRADCEAGAATLGPLRDVTLAQLEAARLTLDPVVYRRCRHVITENARVEAMRVALAEGNLRAAGELMAASHASLRDDFAVSCRELDVLVELAAAVPGVYGARMTGGGFGGCTVNLVAPASVETFTQAVTAGYRAATGLTPEIHVCEAAAGAGRLV